MTQIDVELAHEILARLAATSLTDDAGPPSQPGAGSLPDEQLGPSLLDEIARLHYTVNQQTLEYLRWKMIVVRENAWFAVETARAACGRRLHEKKPTPRTFLTKEFVAWNVREHVGFSAGNQPRHSLMFESDAAVRRVRTYPANWRALTDDELSELSWGR